MENIIKNYYMKQLGNTPGWLLVPTGTGISKYYIAKQIKNISEQEAVEDYENLKDIDLDKITPNTRTGNKFIDYFTFKQRLETKGRTGINFYEFFENKSEHSKKRYIRNLLNYIKKQHNKNIFQMWYGVFNLYFSSISLFKPVVAMEIYARYKPNTVLDFTMSWGGRLVGACALDIPNYIGIDNNKELIKPYERMVDKLKELDTKTNIKLMFKDALKVNYSKLTYDMVFTSPPYYNIELYKETKKQTKEDWDNNFYF
jgi:hypothetical protein